MQTAAARSTTQHRSALKHDRRLTKGFITGKTGRGEEGQGNKDDWCRQLQHDSPLRLPILDAGERVCMQDHGSDTFPPPPALPPRPFKPMKATSPPVTPNTAARGGEVQHCHMQDHGGGSHPAPHLLLPPHFSCPVPRSPRGTIAGC